MTRNTGAVSAAGEAVAPEGVFATAACSLSICPLKVTAGSAAGGGVVTEEVLGTWSRSICPFKVNEGQEELDVVILRVLAHALVIV